MATHYNTLQGLLDAGAGGIVNLNSADIYNENSQVTIPMNTILNMNGATVIPTSGLHRTSWDGSFHVEDFIFNIS